MLRIALLSAVALCSIAHADVTIRHVEGGNTLLVDNKPFWINGVGGDGSKPLLKQIGGNAFRTWGADNLDQQLAEAQQLGLKVVAGIWLEHERHGFSYADPAFVQNQLDRARATIQKYKDHPALLMWSLGNETEGYKDGDDPNIWRAINDIAALAKQIDPKHPTMTVVAEIGGSRVKAIHAHCPAIDVIGINSYAGCASIPTRYRAAGGTKPYIVTEFGPPGTWEVAKTDWAAVPEPTSTAKAASYREAYERGILAERDKLCLGSFAFTWGAKQEATSTWFGMLLPDGSRVAAADTMGELWTGKPPADRVPTVAPIKLTTDRPTGGSTIRATLDAVDPEGSPLTADWTLSEEVEQLGVGGDAEVTPTQIKGAILRGDATGTDVKMPDGPGRYRLAVILRDGHGGAATANVPLFIAADPIKDRLAPQVQLPFVLYGDDQPKPPYIPSGWMGKVDALALDERSHEQPKTGATCMKCEFKSADNFGGIGWQSPANDWGDLAGGFDLTGAKRLSFWARGAAGGEKVEFKFGIIAKAGGKPFPDTATGGTVATLTTDWQQFTIDLAGKDLRRIKTGFAWVVGNPGKPMTFYLDDIRYE